MRPGGTQRVRSKSLSGGLLVSEPSTTEAAVPSVKRVPVCRNLMQWTFCLAAVVLGFRVAHEVDLVRDHLVGMEEASNLFIQISNQTSEVFKSHNTAPGAKSARVYVGRHPILVRAWPHPNPMEMAQAYNMIARVQLEQQRLYGIQSWKPIIAITPMYARTFQSVHLTGLIHTLSLVREPVTWIVVEAGGVSAETAELVRQARVHRLVHLGSSKNLPQSLEDRGILESHLRMEGLRYVREQSLEGVVVFADDSNVYSMQFFDAVQKVEWVGALPVGILGHAGLDSASSPRNLGVSELQVQAPVCDAVSGLIKGWHAFGSLALDTEFVLPARHEQTKLEWAGFVLNARTVWEEAEAGSRPEWIKDWTEWVQPPEDQYVEVRAIMGDETKVEALGACGREEAVLVWWARVEARADSKFPSRWVLDSPLEVIVPAKVTPWPDRVFPPPSPPPPPVARTTKPKGGNRSGRQRRGKRRPDAVKSSPLDKPRVSRPLVSKSMQS